MFASSFTRVVADFLRLFTLTGFRVNSFATRAYALAFITARPSPSFVVALTLAPCFIKPAIYTLGISAGTTVDTSKGIGF